MNGPAGPAAIARPADADDAKPSRHMIEHLAESLADHMQGATAAGAGAMVKVEPHLFAWQMRRQAWPLRPRWGPGRLGRPRRQRCFDPRDVGVDILEAELQLVIIEPFGAPAKLVALQLLNDEAEPFDLGPRLCEGGAFGRKPAHHPLQRFHIVRQGGKIDVHACESTLTRACSH